MPWGLINLGVLFAAFGFLARLCPCNRDQPRFVSRDLPDNVLYWAFGVFLYGDIAGFYIRSGASLLGPAQAQAVAAAIFAGYGWAARLPLALQAVMVIVAMDVIQYWLHRGFHGRTLWPFHAIHHSAIDLDWTAGFRFHPVNFVVYSAGALALVKLIGFSPAVYLVIGPFNLVVGSMVHANLDWTFGPFRYVLASPVFHRWHHVRDPAIHNRNFAPTFPVLDLVFGTYYMPRGELPKDYGVDGVPPHFLAQLIYPFRVLAARLGPSRAEAPIVVEAP
jgi:sterol desaturase/sphingolipid hydroxylase (fatty acid hydroxylase superfamily)